MVLVTGASSGIGRLTADLLHRRGWVVWGASRGIEPLDPKPPFACVTMDVSDEASVAAALARVGAVDAVVNCAGWVLTGAVEELRHLWVLMGLIAGDGRQETPASPRPG